LVSVAELTLSSGSYKMTGSSPIPIYAGGALTIGSNIDITGSSGILDIQSNATVTLNNPVSSSGSISIIGNADCAGSAAGVAINEVLTSTDITIQGGSLAIASTIEVGTGDLTFVEACATTSSIGIGGANPTGTMSISWDELGYISATYSSSKWITFKSQQGPITVFGINQGNDMHNAQLPQIKIKTQAVKNITFSTHGSYFSVLAVESAAGINLEQKIETSYGDMSLTYSGGHLAIGSDAEIECAGDLTLTAGAATHALVGSDPMTVYANGDITLDSHVDITGSSGTMYFAANGTLTANNPIKSSGAISMIGDND